MENKIYVVAYHYRQEWDDGDNILDVNANTSIFYAGYDKQKAIKKFKKIYDKIEQEGNARDQVTFEEWFNEKRINLFSYLDLFSKEEN